MYNYIKGTLEYAQENTVVVEAGGVGYELCVPSTSIAKLGRIGDVCKVYCYLNVKEDDMSLFGFADRAEKELFTRLIDVSGIGCKMAIAILSSGSLSSIVSAIVSADVSALAKIKGIGKKTAERIVVELRDKLSAGGSVPSGEPLFAPVSAPVDNEAVEALLSLGFTRQESIAAVSRHAKEGMTTEEIVLAALRG